MADYFFGEPEGLKVGQIFPDRKALREAKLHLSPRNGIDGNSKVGASSIILNGSYDDKDFGRKIIYTGHGGYDPVLGKQVEDQSWNSPGNKALLVSKAKKKKIRIFRGSKHNSPFSPSDGYAYGGLYYVTEKELSRVNGHLVCRFILRDARSVELEEAKIIVPPVIPEEIPVETERLAAVSEPNEILFQGVAFTEPEPMHPPTKEISFIMLLRNFFQNIKKIIRTYSGQ